MSEKCQTHNRGSMWKPPSYFPQARLWARKRLHIHVEASDIPRWCSRTSSSEHSPSARAGPAQVGVGSAEETIKPLRGRRLGRRKL